MSNATTITPSRQQYLDIKAQYPDAIVLFRLGDFYETFDQDAEVAARELDLVLTSRPQGKNQALPCRRKLHCPPHRQRVQSGFV
jgi:DNA mismatch repair protein MutS